MSLSYCGQESRCDRVEVPDMTESERWHERPNAEDAGVQMKAQLILPRRSSVMP
jgi:hypothetical protein